MERLKKIFPNERGAKIAQGLLQTLFESEQPVLALRITESAQQNIAALIKDLDAKSNKVNYADMFLKLVEKWLCGSRKFEPCFLHESWTK